MRNELREIRDAWYEEAGKQTLETLPDFMKKLAEHPHDYNTICYALAAAATGAAWAMNATPNGGVTGFQAGAVMWEFMDAWNGVKAPARLVRYENMLYPQYAHEFDKVITRSTWKFLQEEAAKNLAEAAVAGAAHINVLNHWKSIVDGQIPFGYVLDQDED